jgi:DNA-binding NtrC family response regulator
MVDDSEIVAESVRRWLKRDGYEVVVTHDCAEARAAAAQRHFSAHVIDLELSDGLGVDLALWLKYTGHSAPNIFYTGHSMGSEAIEQARQFGRVVIKGENPKALLNMLREIAFSIRPPLRSTAPEVKVRPRPKK